MRKLEASAERNQQCVADCATSHDGSAAIGILAQFCKRARHLPRPYRGWGRIFGVQRDTHRDDSLVIIRRCDSPHELRLSICEQKRRTSLRRSQHLVIITEKVVDSVGGAHILPSSVWSVRKFSQPHAQLEDNPAPISNRGRGHVRYTPARHAATRRRIHASGHRVSARGRPIH